MATLISLLISVLIIGLVVWIVFYLLSLLPIPQPFLNVAKVIVVLICLLWVLGMLPGLGWSHPLYLYR